MKTASNHWMKVGFGILFILSIFNSIALAETIIIEKQINSSIGMYAEFIEDIEKKLTIKTVTDPQIKWQSPKNDEFRFGYTKSAYWFRFTLKSTSNLGIERFLEITYPQLDFVDLYIPGPKGDFKIENAGDCYPFNNRKIKDKNFIFRIQEKQGEHTYYLRIETTSTLRFGIILWSDTGYMNNLLKVLPIFWLYFGLMLVMIIYNSIMFFFAREIHYIYYILFIFGYTSYEFAMNGFAFQYLWPDSIWWTNNCIPILICFLLFFGCEFCRSYLKTEYNNPVLNKILISLSIMCGILAMLSFSGNVSLLIKAASILAFLVSIAVISTSIFTACHGSQQGILIIVSTTPIIIGAILFNLLSFGLLPANFITKWSMQIGSSMLVILLAYVLADRINRLKTKLQDLNIHLENKVGERTAELELAVKQTEKINNDLARARDALWGEMELAKKIQFVLLPKMPKINNYEVITYIAPALEIGGDYYDIINAGGKDWIVIGDVSGHGLPSGLIMMMVQTSIHAALNQNPELPPAELIKIINKTITYNIKQLGEDKYLTLTVLACHEDGNFIFAGLHLDIMIYRSATRTVEIIQTSGMWIGILENIEDMLCNSGFKMDINDSMLLYTDGITEAWRKGTTRDVRTARHDMFGELKLRSIFNRLGENSPDAIRNGILKELRDYNCIDDVTMIIIKRIC